MTQIYSNSQESNQTEICLKRKHLCFPPPISSRSGGAWKISCVGAHVIDQEETLLKISLKKLDLPKQAEQSIAPFFVQPNNGVGQPWLGSGPSLDLSLLGTVSSYTKVTSQSPSS